MVLNGSCILLCRGVIEHNISEVAHGRRAKEAVLEEAVQHFRNDYISAAQKQGMPLVPTLCCSRQMLHTLSTGLMVRW